MFLITKTSYDNLTRNFHCSSSFTIPAHLPHSRYLHWVSAWSAVAVLAFGRAIFDKKAVLSQGNRAMLFFSV